MDKQPPPNVVTRFAPHWNRMLHREAARATVYAAHGIPVKRIHVRYRKSWLGDTWSINGHITVKSGEPFDDPYTQAVCHAAAAMGVAEWVRLVDGLSPRQARLEGLNACSGSELLALYRWRSKVRPRVGKAQVLDDTLKLVRAHWSQILRVADRLDRQHDLAGRPLRELLANRV